LFIEIHGNHEQAQTAVQRLTDVYNHNEIGEIIIFQSVGGYDCLFYQ